MKAFVLNYNNAPVAVAKDKWLLELLIVQRGLDRTEYEIKKIKAPKDIKMDDKYHIYLEGYVISNDEYSFLNNRILENRSTLEFLRDKLEAYLKLNKNGKLTKKEEKRILKMIKTISKNIDKPKKKHIRDFIEIIMFHNLAREDMENLKTFKDITRSW